MTIATDDKIILYKDLKKVIKELSKRTEDINLLLNKYYPKGSVVVTYENKNPSTFIGGTWVLIGGSDGKNYYPALAKSGDAAGARINESLPLPTVTLANNGKKTVDFKGTKGFAYQQLGKDNVWGIDYGRHELYEQASFDSVETASNHSHTATVSGTPYSSGANVNVNAYKLFFWRRTDNNTLAADFKNLEFDSNDFIVNDNKIKLKNGGGSSYTAGNGINIASNVISFNGNTLPGYVSSQNQTLQNQNGTIKWGTSNSYSASTGIAISSSNAISFNGLTLPGYDGSAEQVLKNTNGVIAWGAGGGGGDVSNKIDRYKNISVGTSETIESVVNRILGGSSMTGAGFGFLSTAQNIVPSGVSNSGYAEVYKRNEHTMFILYRPYDQLQFYIRRKGSGTWYNWERYEPATGSGGGTVKDISSYFTNNYSDYIGSINATLSENLIHVTITTKSRSVPTSGDLVPKFTKLFTIGTSYKPSTTLISDPGIKFTLAPTSDISSATSGWNIRTSAIIVKEGTGQVYNLAAITSSSYNISIPTTVSFSYYRI